MARLSNTKEQILDRARDLMQSRGFEGFSYKDISSHLGIKNAAVHYHYPSKFDLGLAMIEQFTENVRRRIRQAREDEIPVRVQLDTYFAEVEDELCSKDWTICPMGAMATSYGSISEEMQVAATRLAKLVHEWMVDVLEQGREQGTFRFSGSADDKATEIQCAMQGARQMSRVRSENVVARVVAQFRMELYQ